MSMYYCPLCDTTKDNDFEMMVDTIDGEVCESCAVEAEIEESFED